MSDVHNLFDFEDGEISRSTSNDAKSQVASKMWKIWVVRTEREDLNKENRDFVKAIRKALADGLHEDDVERIVEGAARTEPRVRDPQDIRRVTTALTNPKVKKFALEALETNADVQLNPKHRQKITVRQVEEIINTTRSEWGDDEIESAVALSEKYDEQSLIELVRKVALIVGSDALFPSEVLRNARKVASGNYKIVRNDRRNSYQTGKLETELTEGINFHADKDSDRAYNKGVAPERIVEFHNLAPEGYWAEVSKLLRATKKPHDVIYSTLEDKYGWHPADRAPIRGTKR